MSKDDYIYSYVDRKLVDSKGGHTFDEKRYIDKKFRKSNRGNLQGILIGVLLGLIVVGLIIIIDLSK